MLKHVETSFLLVRKHAITIPPFGVSRDPGTPKEFTAETAFPIPFFVDHPSTGYDLSKISSWTSIQNIIVQGEAD